MKRRHPSGLREKVEPDDSQGLLNFLPVLVSTSPLETEGVWADLVPKKNADPVRVGRKIQLVEVQQLSKGLRVSDWIQMPETICVTSGLGRSTVIEDPQIHIDALECLRRKQSGDSRSKNRNPPPHVASQGGRFKMPLATEREIISATYPVALRSRSTAARLKDR